MKVFKIFAVGIAAAAIVLLGMILSLNTVIRSQGAALASKALGVDVSIGSVSLSLTEQNITLERVAVGTPDGFDAPRTLDFSRIFIDAENIFAKPVIIPAVAIDSYNVYFEMSERGSNISAIRSSIRDSKKKSKRSRKSGSGGSGGTRFFVRRLDVGQGTLHSSASLLGQSVVKKELPIPAFSQHDIGSEKNPVRARVVVELVVFHVLSAALKSNPEIFFSNVKNIIKDASKNLGGALKDFLGR